MNFARTYLLLRLAKEESFVQESSEKILAAITRVNRVGIFRIVNALEGCSDDGNLVSNFGLRARLLLAGAIAELLAASLKSGH